MRRLAIRPIILAMTYPPASAKLMLLEDRRGGSGANAPVPVRRFRLARLRFDAPLADPQDRFAHLKRSHD
jgi:hypothetical protein